MQLQSLVCALLFAVGVLAAEAPTELKIETTYLPESCPAQAKKGDSIQVHYVRRVNSLHQTYLTGIQTGTLFADGKKFDSRFV